MLAEGAREFHQKRWTKNKQQSNVDEGWHRRRGLNVLPLPPPQKKHNLLLGLGGGVAGFDLALKGRAGDVIIMRWTMPMMTTMMMARAARRGSKGKSINDSIS
jgi:hypothetical protein